MLQNLTLVRASYQAMIDLKVDLKVSASMDAGSVTTEIGEHPDYGQVILIDSAMGDATIVVNKDAAEKLSKWLTSH